MFVPQPQCLLMRESGRTASEIRFEGSWLDHLLNPEVVLDPYVCLFWILSYFDLSQQGLVLAEQSEKLMSCYYQGLAAMRLHRSNFLVRNKYSEWISFSSSPIRTIDSSKIIRLWEQRVPKETSTIIAGWIHSTAYCWPDVLSGTDQQGPVSCIGGSLLHPQPGPQNLWGKKINDRKFSEPSGFRELPFVNGILLNRGKRDQQGW